MPESFTDWYKLGTIFLRKVPLYKNSDLSIPEKYCVSCCPYGGPIAIGDSDPKSGGNIYIVTYTGDLKSTIPTLFHQFAWTKDQKLVVFHQDTTISLYSVHGNHLETFNLFKNTKTSLVFGSTFFKQKDTGVFIMNGSQQMWCVNSVSQRTPWGLSSPQKATGAPTCFTIVCNAQLTSVILCYGEQFYMGSQRSELLPVTQPWMLTTGGQYIAASTSWSHKKIAFVHNSMRVHVVSNNLEELLHDISISKCLTMNPSWCGENVLVFQKSPSELVFYSMSEKSYSMPFLKPISYDVDCDGIHVFHRNESFLITVVPEDMTYVLGISSTPGVVLRYAYEKYMEKELKYHLTGIRNNIYEVIDKSLNAAVNTFDIPLQKKLIGVANFGRSMCCDYDPTKFIHVCSILRCLNAVRSIGIPISYLELKELRFNSLIDRLTELHHWPLALELCKTMNIPNEEGTMQVTTNWINYLLSKAISSKSTDINAITQKILHQLEKLSDVNYSEVAKVIYQKDKKRFIELAKSILVHESDPVKRAKVLIEFGDTKTALELAIEIHSSNPNLAYMIVSSLKQTDKRGDVDNLLKKTPFAAKLYQGYAREDSPKLLLTVFQQQNDYLRQSVIHLSAAQAENNVFDPKPRNLALKEAEKCFNQMGNQDLVQLVKSSITLSQQNAAYEAEKGEDLMNKSLRETFIYAVGKGNDPNLAERLKNEHRLTEKQVWKWTVDAYIESDKASNLNDMVYKKQFPGYLSFVEACVRHGKLDLAYKFCNRIERSVDRIKGLTMIGKIMEAADLALETGDASLISNMIPLCRSKEEEDKLLGYLKTMRSKMNRP